MEALLPLIITFGLMWALLIRPQQRRVRQHQELVATLSEGDEVITTGGIVGTIAAAVDDIITLEVAPGTSIRVLRSAVQTRIAPFEAAVIDEDFDALEDAYAEDAYAEDAYAEDAVEPTAPPGASDITGVMPVTPPPAQNPPPADPPTPPPTGEKA